MQPRLIEQPPKFQKDSQHGVSEYRKIGLDCHATPLSRQAGKTSRTAGVPQARMLRFEEFAFQDQQAQGSHVVCMVCVCVCVLVRACVRVRQRGQTMQLGAILDMTRTRNIDEHHAEWPAAICEMPPGGVSKRLRC